MRKRKSTDTTTALPFSLRDELAARDSEGAHGSRVVGHQRRPKSRKEQRAQQRVVKKRKQFEYFQSHSKRTRKALAAGAGALTTAHPIPPVSFQKLNKVHLKKPGDIGGKSLDENLLEERFSSTQQKVSSETKPKVFLDGKSNEHKSDTKFLELLKRDRLISADDGDDDLKLLGQLEKRLGKKNKKSAADKDGLDSVLRGLSVERSMEGNRSDEAEQLDQSVGGPSADDGEPDNGSGVDNDSGAADSASEGASGGGSGEDAIAMAPAPRLKAKVKQAAPAAPAAGRYVPPHLQPGANALDAKVTALKRQLRGLLNRISASSMDTIATETFRLYEQHNRHTVNGVLLELILASCTAGAFVLNRQFIALYAAFIAALHRHLPHRIGAFFVREIGRRVHAAVSGCGDESDESKDAANLLSILVHLYMFQVMDSGLLFDTMRALCSHIDQRSVELLLLILKNAGFQLRSDDPSALKDIVLLVQHNAKKADDNQGSGLSKRLSFMLDAVSDLKNNKKAAFFAEANATGVAQLRTWLAKLDPSPSSEPVQLSWSQLAASGDGAAEEGTDTRHGEMDEKRDGGDESDTAGGAAGEGEDEVLTLARAQRMNTQVRRSVFCAIMTAQDYMDAFEKMMKLNLKGAQQREYIRVLFECSMQERVFNAYYGHLCHKLCSFDHSHKLTLQFCYWDMFKRMHALNSRALANAAHLLSFILLRFSLSLAILKVLDLDNLTRPVILFLRLLFTNMCDASPDDNTLRLVFQRINATKDSVFLRESLLSFLGRHVKVPLTAKVAQSLRPASVPSKTAAGALAPQPARTLAQVELAMQTLDDASALDAPA